MNARAVGRFLDGWVLILGGVGIGLALWLTPLAGASSRDGESLAKRDFDSLINQVSSRYGMHATSVPMMWLANVCANRVTHGGVRGMRVAKFEDADGIAKIRLAPAQFGEMVKAQLGEGWSPMVREHDKKGEGSYFYVQNGGDERFTRLIVVDLDSRELDMVGISLNAAQLAKWMDEHDHDKGGAGRLDASD